MENKNGGRNWKVSNRFFTMEVKYSAVPHHILTYGAVFCCTGNSIVPQLDRCLKFMAFRGGGGGVIFFKVQSFLSPKLT